MKPKESNIPVRDVNVGDFVVRTFDHMEVPIIGVGQNQKHFIDFEPFLDTSCFPKLHQEIKRGLPRCEGILLPKVEGELPPRFRSEYQNRFFEGKALIHASAEDLKNMEGMTRQQRRRYALMYLDAIQPWLFNIYLRNAEFENKSNENNSGKEWSKDIKYFPNLINFLKTLPFKSIGRVLFFCTEPGKGVPPHRDYPPISHKDHNINFFFDGPRPSYIFDCTSNEKFYLPPTRSYFFNNRDYHGVDPENKFRYTLRVDGVFNDYIIKQLSLKDGWVC